MPTGPGSRGGRWHDPEYRRAYYRAWRAAHPDYREREALRKAWGRSRVGLDERVQPHLPLPAVHCASCGIELVALCGFCRAGMAG